uniref:ANK_REP_REGION domain-containing protein n=1 Tax=Macrostomum lignano TaxID=282301 RepID=A0A1I8JQZ1_9PLAT
TPSCVTDGHQREAIVAAHGKDSPQTTSDAYGQSKINLLAVLPWHRWRCSTACLARTLRTPFSTVLDANHNFIPDGGRRSACRPAASAAISASRALALSQFRSRVESLLCRWRRRSASRICLLTAAWSHQLSRQHHGSSPVPHCAILVNGSATTWPACHSCVVTRRCSAVIVKSSGGLADLTCQLLDLLYGEGRVQKPGGQEAILQASTGPLLPALLRPAGGPPTAWRGGGADACSSCWPARHLIEVFSDCRITGPHDIAKERVFTDTKQWTALRGWLQSDLEPLMLQVLLAISSRSPNCCWTRGFSLNTYVTDRVGHNVSMFKRLVGKRIDKPSQLTLHDVYQQQQQILANRHLRGCLQAVIWCLLTGRYNMALRFCRQDQEVMSTGLLCALLLRRLAQATDSVQEREELRLHADRFDGVHFLACMKCTIALSVAVLSECSKEDTGKTCLVLVRPVPHLEGASAFEIGAEGQSLSFIAHGSCQTVLDLMWRGGVTKRLSGAQVCNTPITRSRLLPSRRVSRRRPARRRSAVDLLDFGRVDGRPCVFDSPTAAHFLLRDGGCRPGRVSVSAASDARDPGAAGFEQGESGRLLSRTPAGQRNSCQRFVCDTYEFYSTPVIRFMYTSFAYAIFLALFTYVLLFAMATRCSPGAPSTTGWNLMDIVAIATFLLAGLGVRFAAGAGPRRSGDHRAGLRQRQHAAHLPHPAGRVAVPELLRLLQNFSVHVNLGPKVVMIQTMVSTRTGVMIQTMVTGQRQVVMIQTMVSTRDSEQVVMIQTMVRHHGTATDNPRLSALHGHFPLVFVLLGYGIFAWSTLFPLTYPNVHRSIRDYQQHAEAGLLPNVRRTQDPTSSAVKLRHC